LLLATENGQSHGFGDLRTLGLWAAAAICAVVFVRHQYHTGAPIIPPEMLDNSGARKLMALGIMTGLTMFMLVFYVPLLLQGGFGQSPKEAGLVMTPLLVFITAGSIINGRILPHLRRAERVIAWGQLGMLISCLFLTQLNVDTPRSLTIAVFAVCGISLGFQLPNLTLQMMGVAGRKNLGVGSALIQSTRMIGSMVGVGVASILVNLLYARQIAAALIQSGVTDAAVIKLLSSPQVLIREQDRVVLLDLAHRLGLDVTPLLEAAREGLIRGVHSAFLVCAVIAGLSICISLRLPPYEISKNR